MDQTFKLLRGQASQVAPRLLGCELIRTIDNEAVRVRIVETEAYDQNDVASHSYKGKTARTDVMFGPPGHLYVYFTYGLHYCCNIVVGPKGYGSAVLIRAVEPMQGLDVIKARRPKATDLNLTNGPAKLCQGLAIDRRLNGHDLARPPLQLLVRPKLAAADIIQTTRIGISRAKDTKWRFYLANNHYVSKPRASVGFI